MDMIVRQCKIIVFLIYMAIMLVDGLAKGSSELHKH